MKISGKFTMLSMSSLTVTHCDLQRKANVIAFEKPGVIRVWQLTTAQSHC